MNDEQHSELEMLVDTILIVTFPAQFVRVCVRETRNNCDCGLNDNERLA